MVGSELMKTRLRFSLALLALAFVAPLLGATSAYGEPGVVVYPITSSGGIDAAAGGNIAVVIATKLTQLGGVNVLPSTPGTERAKYLVAATASGADYYITGFLTPIGSESSLITQVVSTQSGSIIFSATGTVRTYADALAQVDALHTAIVRHAGRGIAAREAAPPVPSSSPPPTASEGSVDIGRALRKRKRGATSRNPSPSPSPLRGTSAVPPLPAATGPATFLLTIEGAPASEETQAMRALVDGFARARRPVTVLGEALGATPGRAQALCAARLGARELDTATMVIGHDERGSERVQLDLTAYDCNGTQVRTRRALATVSRRGTVRDAIARAARDATRAFTAP